MLAERHVFDEAEVHAFNQSQSKKIVEIRKKRLEQENAKRIAREKLKALLTTVILLAVFSSMFGVLIYKNSLVNEKKYEIFALKSQIKSLNTQIEELETAMENTTDIKTVEKMALETLNMQYPTKDQYVYIDSSANYMVSESTEIALAENDVIKPIVQVHEEGSLSDAITALFTTQ